jgi:hypothetical protein
VKKEYLEAACRQYRKPPRRLCKNERAVRLRRALKHFYSPFASTKETTMIMRRRPAAPAPARTSLLGTMARTAVVVGTANAVTNKMNGPAQAAPAAQPAAPQTPMAAAPAAPAGMTPEKMELLKGLADLKAQGILSDAEFAAEKAKLLA